MQPTVLLLALAAAAAALPLGTVPRDNQMPAPPAVDNGPQDNHVTQRDDSVSGPLFDARADTSVVDIPQDDDEDIEKRDSDVLAPPYDDPQVVEDDEDDNDIQKRDDSPPYDDPQVAEDDEDDTDDDSTAAIEARDYVDNPDVAEDDDNNDDEDSNSIERRDSVEAFDDVDVPEEEGNDDDGDEIAARDYDVSDAPVEDEGEVY
ncbi:hypothetical protein F5144DRAFT_581395 [Chaetomium tenue]|uniref:Uncharacterized protein n=1 Tax=Chaetomium tenue TaxID=1854479 RepID=A0ACB7P0D6_9PEZI|nr:hypothetical protein F5144DRAFT_581395 [Chaetomium globosum]